MIKIVRPEDITNALDNKWFTGLAGFGDWIVTILISIICLVALYILWNFLEHRKKITVFPLYGAEELPEVKKGKALSMADLQKYPNLQIGVPKKLKGKRVKQKGVKKFQILKNPFKWKKIPDVPYEYEYSEGFWMVEPTKDHFIPIKRPTVKDAINIKVPENDMDFWMQLENEELMQRTKDENDSKRQMIMTISIIIGAFILAGIIIWLSMSFAGKNLGLAYDKADQVISGLQNFVQQKGPG